VFTASGSGVMMTAIRRTTPLSFDNAAPRGCFRDYLKIHVLRYITWGAAGDSNVHSVAPQAGGRVFTVI
jgi:hypothetical protein